MPALTISSCSPTVLIEVAYPEPLTLDPIEGPVEGGFFGNVWGLPAGSYHTLFRVQAQNRVTKKGVWYEPRGTQPSGPVFYVLCEAVLTGCRR